VPNRLLLLLVSGTALVASSALSQSIITERAVAAHEAFLASDALQGRASASRDEAIAAAYVASQFQSFGLERAPGMTDYLQTAPVIREHIAGPGKIMSDGMTDVAPTVLLAPSEPITGKLAVATSADAKAMPAGEVVLVSALNADVGAFYRAASKARAKVLLLTGDEAGTAKLVDLFGAAPRIYLENDPPKHRLAIAIVRPAEAAALARQEGKPVTLAVPVTRDRGVTTNAVGYLRGSDPDAGTLLLTAHLDHLGMHADGTIMPGANDDASGTTAVLELARALSAGSRPKRSILFVAYGSEEVGGYGSTFFAQNPPVPLDRIIANIEFEMIGAQDPKLPPNTLMMTGFERSNLGTALKEHGALVTGDPYPDEHFFQRSDNYSLALKGVVAHTVSGWAVVPTYHKPTDTAANLNIAFMTNAIRSLVAPIEWIANSDFVPAWSPGGKPTAER
jgi:hypothetical protein